MVGTAPKAGYWLLRPEDGHSEYIIEEDNWVAAAEFADSVGADIINSSLGFSFFDDPSQNHTYADMNGNTTRVTIGADIAASKGILVVNSAGNFGGTFWQHISAPSDGDSVLCVGAVDPLGFYTPFSSTGPASDGRIKPNIVAQGQSTILVSTNGIAAGNGTSFSAPVISGMAACLWQANPDANNMQIIRAMEKSASQHTNPDSLLGYGIPNFAIAGILLNEQIKPYLAQGNIIAAPNPFSDQLYVAYESSGQENAKVEMFDNSGRLVLTKDGIQSYPGRNVISIENARSLSKGFYFIRVTSNKPFKPFKVVKAE